MSDITENIRAFYTTRMDNSKNSYQGTSKRVLCVCSAGLLRSPTAAVVLAGEPYNYNTRAAGLETPYALIPIDPVLLYWADEIVCMTEDQVLRVEALLKEQGIERKVQCLGISDSYPYRDPELIEKIKANYKP